MPITVRTADGSKFINGRMMGFGEIYREDIKTGEGSVTIGNFNNGLLDDSAGILIEYDNNGFICYKGNFSNGRMNGNVEVLEYSPDNPNFRGHFRGYGSYVLYGIKVSRIIKLFSNDVEDSIISPSVPSTVTVDVCQKKYNNVGIINNFNISD